MDSVVASLVTILAEGDASELEPLLDMVGIRGARSATDSAGHLFNGGEMASLSGAQSVVHV